MSALSMLLLLCAGVALVAMAYFVWQRRRSGFMRAVSQLTAEFGASSPYQVPWVVMFGAMAERNSALCRDAWHLDAVGDAGRFGTWWRGPDGAVMSFAEEASGDGAGKWSAFLRALTRIRSKRPLDAVIWVIDAGLMSDAKAAALAGQAAQRRMSDLLQRTGLSVPVYIIIDRCGSIPELQEYSQLLPCEARDTLLGWASPFPPATPYAAEWIDLMLHRLLSAIEQSSLTAAAMRGALSERVFRISDALAQWRAPLLSLIDPVFHGNAIGETHCLRGCFLVVDLPTMVENAAGVETESAHARNILPDRVLAEQGIAQPVPRLLAGRTRTYRVAAGLVGFAAIAYLVFAGALWYIRADEAQELAQTLDRLRTHAAGDQPHSRAAVSEISNALTSVRQWELSSWGLPTSKFSNIDREIEAFIARDMFNDFFVAISSGLSTRIDSVGISDYADYGKNDSKASRYLNNPGRPDLWPEFEAVRALVNAAADYEDKAEKFNSLLEKDSGELKSFDELGNYVFGIHIDSERIRDKARIERLIRQVTGSDDLKVNLELHRSRISKQFSGLMLRWIDTLYGTPRLSAAGRDVEVLLDKLQSYPPSSDDLVGLLNGALDRLSAEIALVNSAWKVAGAEKFSPEVQTVFDTARRSALIGGSVVDAVLQHGDDSRRAFHARWIASEESQSSLLSVSPAGSIELKPDVVAFHKALKPLVRKSLSSLGNLDYSYSVLEGRKRIPQANVSEAMRTFEKYTAFVDQGAMQVPPFYRPALLEWLSHWTAATMLSQLAAQGEEDGGDEALLLDDEAAIVDAVQKQSAKLAAAFERLGRRDTAAWIVAMARNQTYELLARAEQTLLALEHYAPRPGVLSAWDGQAGLSRKLYGLTSTNEIAAYLTAQRESIAMVASSMTGAISWLLAHPAQKNPTQTRLLERWQSLQTDISRHASKSPSSAMVALEQLIGVDFLEMTSANCRQRLDNARLPSLDSLLAQRYRSLLFQAQTSCGEIRAQQASAAYQQIFRQFNQTLAGRFPFSDSVNAPSANPGLVAAFLRSAEPSIELITQGLADIPADEARETRQFLNGVTRMLAWLKPLTFPRNDVDQGLDIQLHWRTNRNEEYGGDKIIEWKLDIGSQTLRYPVESKTTANWRVGQPIVLALRWASNSPIVPRSDAKFENAILTIDGRQASWTIESPWSLLQFLRSFRARPSDQEDGSGFSTLAVRVPTVGSATHSQAQVFIEVGVTPPGNSKEPLPALIFPSVAPASPFALRPASPVSP